MLKGSRRVGLILGIAALVAAMATAAPDPSDPNKDLGAAQLKIVRLALKNLDMLNKGGALNLSDPKFALWERRQIEALRAAGARKGELVEAIEAYLKRMKEQERSTQSAYEKDQLTRLDLMDVQFRTLEAEIWLNQEKSR